MFDKKLYISSQVEEILKNVKWDSFTGEVISQLLIDRLYHEENLCKLRDRITALYSDIERNKTYGIPNKTEVLNLSGAFPSTAQVFFSEEGIEGYFYSENSRDLVCFKASKNSIIDVERYSGADVATYKTLINGSSLDILECPYFTPEDTFTLTAFNKDQGISLLESMIYGERKEQKVNVKKN